MLNHRQEDTYLQKTPTKKNKLSKNVENGPQYTQDIYFVGPLDQSRNFLDLVLEKKRLVEVDNEVGLTP